MSNYLGRCTVNSKHADPPRHTLQQFPAISHEETTAISTLWSDNELSKITRGRA